MDSGPSALSDVGRLELGGVDRCGATLFTPSAAVTAAHCLVPGMTEVTPRDAVLAIGGGVELQRFPVDRAWAFGSHRREGDAAFNGDVAVLHLATPVPARVATPRPLAASGVRPGEEVTLASLDESRSGGTRRLRSWRFRPASTDRVLSPGDSGSPLLLGGTNELGPVVAVASGYATTPCASSVPDRALFGDVARVRGAIETTLAQWEGDPSRPR